MSNVERMTEIYREVIGVVHQLVPGTSTATWDRIFAEAANEPEKCTFPGCTGTFHPDLVRDPGPHNNPPGDTGWAFDYQREDPNLPAHEHSLKSPHPEAASASPHNRPDWDGKVFVSVTLDADPDSVEMGSIVDLEILDRKPAWDGAGGSWNPIFEGYINGGDSVHLPGS